MHNGVVSPKKKCLTPLYQPYVLMLIH